MIEDNYFETFDRPVLFAKSIDGLIFKNNVIRQNTDYPAFHHNKSRFRLLHTECEDRRIILRMGMRV